LLIEGFNSLEQLVEVLRGCADRSWLAGRAAVPTLANPTFSDQSPHNNDYL
jgi:hypothetical protein